MDRFNEDEIKKGLNAKLFTLGGEQQERLARNRAQALGLSYVNLTVFPIDQDVLERLPKSLAEKGSAVLFYKQGKDVRVGVVNPSAPFVKEVIGHIQGSFNVEPQIHIISHRSFISALSRYRREQTVAAQPDGQFFITKEEMVGFEEGLASMQKLGRHIASMPPSEIITTLLAGAIKMDSSDLHIEPTDKGARLRYRIDGVLQDIALFPISGYQLVLSRVKVLSGLKLNVREVPQDGSFILNIGDGIYDVRVSVLPGGEGENIVMRFLNRTAQAVKITQLGMKQRDFKVMMEELKKSDGMILVTGPTGSGKTTSLASFITEVNSPELKVITLEDPIEYRLPGVEQTQVDHSAGYTFAKGLRSILRQDPDMIMVGEIRDAETAEVALHASLTGHLVFSTLHTNDAPGAVPRLVDMGMQSFVIAPAVNVVIAQRLVRVVCSKCGEEYEPDAELRKRIAKVMTGVSPEIFNLSTLQKSDLKFKKAKGCNACNNTGYKGRVGVFEVMPVRGEIEELILQGADGATLRVTAMKGGMTTIAQDGYLKVIEGVTTVEEVARITAE